VENLTYRLIKGSDLTGLELDDNFRKLRAAINALEAASSSSSSSEVVGVIKPYAGAALPSGYLWANGQAVSRTVYADLYAVCDINYGAGNGTTTFNVPDLRGGVPIGSNPMGGTTRVGVTAYDIGDYVGAESNSIPHSHTASGTISITPVNYTPSGTVSVVAYTGTAPVTVSITVDSATIPYTPEGIVSLDLGDASASGSGGVYAATFAGTPTNFNHTHTASAIGSSVTLNHGHSASFVGAAATLSPTGTTSITVDSASPTVSVVQLSTTCNYIIKY